MYNVRTRMTRAPRARPSYYDALLLYGRTLLTIGRSPVLFGGYGLPYSPQTNMSTTLAYYSNP